jgi:hypothetical protein
VRGDHVQRGQPFGMARDPCHASINEQSVTVRHQRMANEAQLGFPTLTETV